MAIPWPEGSGGKERLRVEHSNANAELIALMPSDHYARTPLDRRVELIRQRFPAHARIVRTWAVVKLERMVVGGPVPTVHLATYESEAAVD